MSEIRFERATTQYAGAETAAVSALELRVGSGELLVLCGAPNAGKSTVLRIVAGLVPISSGRVLIGGVDVSNPSPSTPLVSMVFQNYALYPHLTVAQNIALPLTQRGLGRALIADQVKRVAEPLGLLAHLGGRPAPLTAGQRIRVALARALVRDPAVLLLDEPLANLRPEIRHEVAELLVEAQARHGVTTLYATDDLEEAIAVGHRVAQLDRGVLKQVRTSGEWSSASA
ncbi:ABC transporter ATP-binding protein [Nocardioides gilvus]|uniref:ABC transporter ATP-binding protein n=1 Tax=Nocardioides gilvus TaxID=1735589 RepID=UPI0013A585A9|nr:ATP-binding cassette domain-containing protein [Nocardioides gilvus]